MTLRIGLILPDLLGTYGDSGNAVVLAHRARARGHDAQVLTVHYGEPIPDSLDIYALGGGEDVAQSLAAAHLLADGGLARAVERGAPVLAICAGLQVLGEWFTDAEGRRVQGCGLIDARTTPSGSRMIGELAVKPSSLLADWAVDDVLLGFENHGGRTELGPDAAPLGEVLSGWGNGAKDGATDGRLDGAIAGSVLGTYAHGPVLARNPQLADALLARALGVGVADLAPVEVELQQRLRAERAAAAKVKL
ncbi:glutamine amidotransferase [Buchananella felis]|uniref:type 1 glutamine amidotransferase n=1 Tax=Buchananella felis TaxID=3231492 RepID=UPI003528E761